MDERSTGLILRTRPFTETSLIAHWLTPDLGRIATLAKGARRPKSPFQGKLDLFFLADFSFHRSRSGTLHTLREVSVRDFNTALRQELQYLQQAAYFAQLLEQATETDTPLPAFFQLAVEALAVLPQRPPRSLTVYVFEMKLLQELGLQPDLRRAQLTPGAAAILKKLTDADWNLAERLRPTPGQDREISTFLAGFLLEHLEKVPPSRAAALCREFSANSRR